MEVENKNSPNSAVDFYYVSGLTSVLYDHDHELIRESLESLIPIIDSSWSEISECLPQIVYLSKDQSFPYRSLAAYVASKCFFNLHQYKESFYAALDSGEYFDYKQRNEYTETMIITCLDIYTEYIKTRGQNSEPLDSRIQEIVNYIFETSSSKDEYMNIIGTAIECRDLTICKDLLLSRKDLRLLFYVEDAIQDIDMASSEKLALLLPLKEYYRAIDEFGYYYAIFLYKYKQTDELFEFVFQLLSSPLSPNTTSQNHIPLLIAYQLASDFYLLNDYNQNLELEKYLKTKLESNSNNNYLSYVIPQFNKLLSGTQINELYNDVLKYNNKFDNIYVNKLFKDISSDPAIQSTAVLSMALMNLGTSNSPVVANISSRWLKNVKNWHLFFIVQSFAPIYKYQPTTIDRTYNSYLTGNKDKKGGALAGISMIYMNRHELVIPKIRNIAAHNMKSDSIYFAAGSILCFGSMYMNDRSYYTETGEMDPESVAFKGYQQLLEHIHGDSPDLGMYSGLALGMFYYNKLDYHLNDLFTTIYTTMEETQHEKITLGTGIGLALALYQTQETALPLIHKLLDSRNEMCRYCAIYIYGSAYMGTGNTEAIREILNVMITDNSEDVLRACPIALYLVLYNEKKQLLDLLLPLLNSYSPFIRHSAVLALGYVLAEGDPFTLMDAKAYQELIDKLFTMIEKGDDVVNQAIYIALGFIFMGKNNKNVKRIPEFKKKIIDLLYRSAGKSFSYVILSCVGALMGAGLIDVGGRNAVYSLYGYDHSFDVTKVFSFIIYQQFWYWHSFLGYFMNLFTPTALLAVDSTLNLPKDFHLLNHTPFSDYDYYPQEIAKKESERSQFETNILNFTKKNYIPTIQQIPEEEEEEKEEETPSGIDCPLLENVLEEETPVDEPDHYTIQNGMRVLPIQYKHLSIPTQRFVPVLQHCYPSLYRFNSNLTILFDTEVPSLEALSHPVSKIYMKIGQDDSTVDPKTPAPFIYKVPDSTEDKTN